MPEQPPLVHSSILEDMADGYLETHYAEYEKRKAAWLRKRSHLPARKPMVTPTPRPDDEAL